MPTNAPSYKPSHDTAQARGTTAERGYDYKWQQTAKRYRKRYPLCEDCEEQGRMRRASEVHHIVKHGGNPVLLYDPSNLRSLCRTCHQRRTNQGE